MPVPQPFVSALEAQEHNSAHGFQEHTCCLKAGFEREAFKLQPAESTCLMSLPWSSQVSQDASQQSRGMGSRSYKQESYGSAAAASCRTTLFVLVTRPLWICSQETVWSRSAQGQPENKLSTTVWTQAAPGLARHKPMLLPGPYLSQEWWETSNKG